MGNNYLGLNAMVNVGFAAMLIGAFDPLEGAFLILPGSALVALGVYLSDGEQKFKIYRLWVCGLISFGVAALMWLSMLGGFGPAELSIWWGVLCLPYLVGWVMGIVGADSPRWVLWLGLVAGCWFMALPILMSSLLSEPAPEAAGTILVFKTVMGLTGLLTTAGSIYRIRKTASASHG